MFCIQETDTAHSDRFSTSDKDPLSVTGTESSDEEPSAKRTKPNYNSSSLNLQVYKIPAYTIPKTQNSLPVFPSTPSNTLPSFVNNPLNLANPLNLSSIQSNNVKSLHSRYSLPPKLSITPVHNSVSKVTSNSGDIVRYKKNGEIAKKRGPPKGYKRKPKDLSQSFFNAALLQTQNAILSNLLAANNMTLSMVPPFVPPMVKQPPPVVPPVPQIRVPEGVEVIELLLDPEDWFPSEPYKMMFSRKKNPKWKSFPYRCEYCFKGYRVLSTLLTHAAERHGSLPKEFAIPCPCCPHVSTRRKHHKKHLDSHTHRRRIFCPYCIPPLEPSEPYRKECERYPFDQYPQYWFASEESLRLHKKRKHPYSAMYNYNWFCTWGDAQPNS